MSIPQVARVRGDDGAVAHHAAAGRLPAGRRRVVRGGEGGAKSYLYFYHNEAN